MTVSSPDLSTELTLKQRDEVVADYLEDIQVRTGSTVAITPGTQPDIDAQGIADTTAPLYGNCQVMSDGTIARTARGDRLEAQLINRGLKGRLPASGSTGYVEIVASAGGTTILKDDELTDPSNTVVAMCAVSGIYLDRAGVPVLTSTTGPAANLAAGVQMKWVSPRPGCGPVATVKATSDGKGLTGGREVERDDEMLRRFEADVANPGTSGNDADYQRQTKTTPNVPIAQAFTYPAIKGTGTTAVVILVRPDRPGGGRRPTTLQIAQSEGNTTGIMPGDHGSFWPQVLQQLVTIALKVSWIPEAAGWADLVPWPTFAQGMHVATVTSATAFQVAGTGTAPTAGKQLALYDVETGTFVRKRIASVTGSGPWNLVIDTTNESSDVTFLPTSGQLVCPWSDSLQLLVSPVVGYFEGTADSDGIGPGEMVATFYDEGVRQRRQPAPPRWPSTIENRLIEPVFRVQAIKDAALLAPTVPYATTVGVPGATVYVLELGDLVAFAS